MADAGRIGDQAVKETNEGELCGPADQAAEHTFINGQRALRVGDGCTSGGSTWKATNGSSAVFIEGRPAVRKGDDTTHSGPGNVVKGSPDTKIGDGKGTAPPAAHDLSLTIVLKDASDRDIKNAHLRITCPHPGQAQPDKPFSERITARSLCAAAKLDVFKSLERGNWDPVAISGTKLTVSPHLVSGAYWYTDPAPEKNVLLTMDWKKEDQVNIPRVDPGAAAAPAPAAGAVAPAAPTSPSGSAPTTTAAPAAQSAPSASAASTATTTFPTSGGTASIRMPTAYNWMELVYKAFNLVMPTAAKAAALLSVRDGVLLSNDTHPTRDDDFYATPNSGPADGNVAGVPKDQQGNTTRFSDLVFFAVAPTDAADVQRVEAFQATVDPGFIESTEGMPLLLEGKQYYCRPTQHHGHPALEIFTAGQTITVTRLNATNTKAGHRTFVELADAGSTGKFVVDDTMAAGIHMHYSMDANEATTKPTSSDGLAHVRNWSSGCTVLAHGPSSNRYTQDYLAIINAASDQSKIPYLVVANKYVLSYAEWIAKIQDHPEEAPKPASVLRKDGLQSPDGQPGKYVPSIMTVGFANAALAQSDGAALALAKSPATQATYSQNLSQSMEKALFTTVTP
jgi:uncharacterized Zn-binding protein involved in type VI secretion